MTTLDSFSEVKPSITDFQKIFSFTATGLKPNTYYDVFCQNKISNHCATQDPTRTNPYSKTLKRIKNIDSTGVNIAAAGVTSNTTSGTFNWPSDLPLKTDASGHIRFEFDGSTWIKDGGQGTSTAQAVGSITQSTGPGQSFNLNTTNGTIYGLVGITVTKTSLINGLQYYAFTDQKTGNFIANGVELSPGRVFIGTGNFSLTPYLVDTSGNKVSGIVYSKGYTISAPAPTNFKMNVTVKESNYVDPTPEQPVIPQPVVPDVPLGPPAVPVGWSTTKPDVPANTVTERVISSNTVTTSKDLGVLRVKKQFGTGGQVPLSEVSLYFDYAQTFYLDPATFDNSQYVTLTSINLYFKSKPHRTNNQSGLTNPGVYLFICEADSDVPNLRKAYKDSIVRVDYNKVSTSLDSNNFTSFDFDSPLSLKTGKSYAMVINFEDPQYSLWTATQGVKLINSELRCDSAYNFGKLYRASNYLEIDNDPKTQDEVLKPIPATDLKFDIVGLEYTDNNGNLQSVNVELVNDDYEFIQVQNIFSEQVGYTNIFEAFGNRQYVYQDFGNPSSNVVYYKPGRLSFGTISYTPGGMFSNDIFKAVGPTQRYPQSTIITGVGTKFTLDAPRNGNIVITDGIVSNTLTGFIANTCIRRVSFIANDTCIAINKPCSFSSNAAYFKVVAMAEMESAYQNPDTLILIKSNAGEDIHFVANAVNTITFTGGSGYTNTDYITFTGAGAKRNGRASITTNTTGGITSINIVNTGYGFTSSPVVTVYNKNNGLSTGSGATFQVGIGGQIKSELYGARADIVDVVSYPVNNFIPNLDFNLKGGVISNNSINFAFINSSNQYDLVDSNFVPVVTEQSVDITSYNAIIMSKSLEVLNTRNLVRSTSEGKSSLIKFTMTASNKYDSPELHEELTSIYAFYNEINNDATNEHTNFGNAVARHISKKITFDKDRFAEDIRVIATAYRPEGTDIKIYAKVHNSKDEDAFDDKTWTELEIKDATFGGRLYSSRANKKDYVELSYGFKAYPDFSTTLAGDAFVYSAAGNTTVTGVGTSFNTDLANGDIIVLYDEDFPNTTYGVAMVANTPTATAFEINKAFANISLESATLKIGKSNKPYMVFNDIHNDNVATYYSTSVNEFTTYDTFSVKVVMVSNSTYIVPRLNDIRAIGVSA